MSIAKKGKSLSKKHINKIKVAVSGENNPFYNKHHSIDTRKKIVKFTLMDLSYYYFI